jgi:phosphoribosylformimino-5-aminoimidazole carboxamide ribonucleotide (ProFAR) isomerase
MMMLNRVNRAGMQFRLREVFSEKKQTHIQTGNKSIVVDVDIRTLDHAWNEWKNNGAYIQTAFLFLTPDQMEFLMTGITPEEWKEMFKDIEQ